MQGQTIPVIKVFRFLDILFYSEINWKTHVEALCAQLNRRCNPIKIIINSQSGTQTNTLILLYKSLTRSKIDYGSILLTTASKALKNKLETPQNVILRIILGATKSATLLYLDIGVESLYLRREWLSRKFLTKPNIIQTARPMMWKSSKPKYLGSLAASLV